MATTEAVHNSAAINIVRTITSLARTNMDFEVMRVPFGRELSKTLGEHHVDLSLSGSMRFAQGLAVMPVEPIDLNV